MQTDSKLLQRSIIFFMLLGMVFLWGVTPLDAAARHHRYMLGADIDNLQELTYQDRKRIHNLKYFTWVEQQGKTYEEIQAQWYDPAYWTDLHGHVDEMDALIDAFNHRTGLL